MVATKILLIFLFITTVYGDTVTTIPSIGNGIDVDDDAIKIGDDVQLLSNDYLSSIANQVGKDVWLKPNLIERGFDIILTNGFLEFEVNLKYCMGKSEICYNSTDKQDQLNEICFNGFCGFSVEGVNENIDKNWVYIGGRDSEFINRRYLTACASNIIRMQYWQTIFCYEHARDYLKTAPSCAPKMDSQNKIHILIRQTSPDCPIKIKNAQIYVPPTPTSSTHPSTIPTTLPSTKPPKVEDASVVKVWWFWLIIGVSLFIILIAVLIIIMIWKELCCFAKKKPKPNVTMVVQPPLPPQFGQPPPTTPMEIVTSGPPPIDTAAKVPSKDKKHKDSGNAIEESISTNQQPQLPPTTAAAVSSTPVKAEKDKPKKNDTVAADKKVQPRKQNAGKPKELKPALKPLPPPSATSESSRIVQPQKTPYRSKGTVAADKKISPSKPRPAQSRPPPPPTSSITSETVSNQNHPQKTDGSKMSNISSMKFKTTTVDE